MCCRCRHLPYLAQIGRRLVVWVVGVEVVGSVVEVVVLVGVIVVAKVVVVVVVVEVVFFSSRLWREKYGASSGSDTVVGG